METLEKSVKSFDMDAANTKYQDICSSIWTMARITAQTAFHRYYRNIHQSLYLYHTPSFGAIPGKLCVAAQLPGDGWKASDHQPIPKGFTENQMTNWLHGIIRRLPILAGDEN